MPICFKCGKDLATDQSLQYHLQKRTKCNTLGCPRCKKQFANKILLENHKHECLPETPCNSNIRYTIFDTIQSKHVYLIELNKEYQIKYISNNFATELNEKKTELLNKNINDFMKLENILKNTLSNAEIQRDGKRINLDITYNDDNILLVETLVC